MTNKDAAEKYAKLAKDIAKAVNGIADAKNTAEFLAKQANDNGDPAYLLDEALSKLASALAMTVEYSSEYETEDPDKDTNTQD